MGFVDEFSGFNIGFDCGFNIGFDCDFFVFEMCDTTLMIKYITQAPATTYSINLKEISGRGTSKELSLYDMFKGVHQQPGLSNIIVYNCFHKYAFAIEYDH